VNTYETKDVLFFTTNDTIVFYAKNSDDESVESINKMLFDIAEKIGDIQSKKLLFCNSRFFYNGIIVDRNNCFIDYIICNTFSIGDAIEKMTTDDTTCNILTSS